MENRSEHSPPEQPAWNTAYFSPPQPPRTSLQKAAAEADAIANTPQADLCLHLRAQFQMLLEDDAAIRPETAALHAHLSVCTECRREYQALGRMVGLLERMPLADLPMDYSQRIMHRIQIGKLDAEEAAVTVQTTALCDRVRERLQPLLEMRMNPDQAGEALKPEMASALYGHMAVCADCSREFETMQRMINLLDTMPASELPMDYSLQIMRRIQAGVLTTQPSVSPAREQAASRPSLAASSHASGEAAYNSRQTVGIKATRSAGTRTSEQLNSWQRLVLSVALSGMVVYMLASDWGRQMLNVNLEAAHLWLAQVGEQLGRVPVLGFIVASVGAALFSINEALNQTFATLGAIAAQTLALEVALGMTAILLIARRQQNIPGITSS